VGGGCILSISPYWPLPRCTHRVAKGPRFQTWTWPEPEITGLAQTCHLFLKPVFTTKVKFTEWVKICATAEHQKTVVCMGSCRYTVYHTENSNQLYQNIGIILHKHSLLVNDNTAECGIMFLQKKINYHETIYDGA